MAKCFNCDKSTMWGRSHTHHRGVAGGRWKKRAPKTNRKFKANVQKMTIMIDGKKKQVGLCTGCIKRVKFDLLKGVTPQLQIVKLQPKLMTLDAKK